jgi:hypothetical protein
MAGRFLVKFSFGVFWFSALTDLADHTDWRGKVLCATLGFVSRKIRLVISQVRSAKTAQCLVLTFVFCLLGSFRQNALRASLLQSSVVIARQRARPLAGRLTGSGGRSSNR